MELPTGTVTFLFTDVQGSTRLLEALGPEFDDLMQLHHLVLRASVEQHGGVVFETEGDAAFAVFAAAGEAVAAARDAQRHLSAHPWPENGRVRVRMAVHTGDARQVGNGYYGMSLHVAARVCSAGHGGQVLLTGATRVLVPGCDVRDLGEHRLKDLSEPVPIVQLLGAGLAESFPPLRSLTWAPTNLPASTDEFVGRAVQLAEVVDGLTSHRLVTLTGAGGSGKTRLALEAADGLQGSFRHGAWLVELAPLSAAAELPGQVAQVLGLGERPGQSVQETLVEWLGGHEVLLILDNCEHLIEEVAAFVDVLLHSDPTVRILATSQELLGVRGELALRVPPLDLDGEAPELFLTRARALVPGFDPASEDDELVRQVCRRLDGLPLAIEMAVARLRSLPLKELAARLDDRFRLLTGGTRTAPSRQRTLAAVVDWSYRLLTGPERELFRAVSVFPDSFTREAAAMVAGSDVVDAIDILGRLVEKSFVVHGEARSANDRYQLLETLRQYGRDRLLELDEAEWRRDALLAWAMSRVERLEHDMRTPRMDAALAGVMPERTNMRAAVEWATQRGDLTSALRLVTAVPLGLSSERRGLIETLLAEGGDGVPPDVVAQARLTLSDLALEQGDWVAVVPLAVSARVGFVGLGNRRHAAWAMNKELFGRWGMGQLAEVDRLVDACLAEFRAVEDAFGIAHTLWPAALRAPDRQTATSLAAESEQRFAELGSDMMRAHALEARGLIELEAGDLPAAAPFLREAVDTLAGLGNLGCTAHALDAAAVWAAECGDVDAAGELVGAADALRETSGAGHKAWEPRARHGSEDDWSVLADTDSVRASVALGRLHSVTAAAALVHALLSPPA